MPLSPLQRRNYFFHCLEGGFYAAGIAFVAVETVLPPMINKLGGPDWVIALAPALLHICFFLPGLFAASLTESLPRLFPFVAAVGIAQRLPYLLAALVLAFAGDQYSGLVLWVVVLTPIISGLSGGIAIPAWMELVTRLVPEHRRASAWAYRFLIATLLGTLVGFGIEGVLASYPGATGYAILHAGAFAGIMISFALFCQLREPASSPPATPDRKRDWHRHQIQMFAAILGTPSAFRRMLTTRILGSGFFIIIPYLSITALEVTGRPESDLGRFVVAQMVGALVGNVVGGWLGDRVGGKAVLVAAKSVQLLLCLVLAFNTSYVGFLAAFVLFGMGFFLNQVGESTLGIELAPRKGRPAYLALLNLSFVPGALMASFLAWQLHLRSASLLPSSVMAALLIVSSLVLLRTIPEPRRANSV